MLRYAIVTAICGLIAFCSGCVSAAPQFVPKDTTTIPNFDPLPALDAYNVAWSTPSADSSGSMPLGNGDIAANIWCEPNGDVLFLLSKSDAWSEVGRLLKLGRVRLHLETDPLPDHSQSSAAFSQVLHLRDGSIEINRGQTHLKIWIDANAPLVHIEGASASPLKIRASFETWRDAPRVISGKEADSASGLSDAPFPVVESGDIIAADKDRILFFHRNQSSTWKGSLELQGMGDWAKNHADPLLNRTFGGALLGEGFKAEGASTLVSAAPRKKFSLSIACLTSQTASADEWKTQLEKQLAPLASTPRTAAWQAHEKWWREFWNRSYVFVSGDEDAKTVTRGYILQRFVTACAGRGAFPIKFNGSLFSVEAREPEENFNADYRRWGGAYWFQNTRLMYWPLLASGDFDLMQPLFKMYRDALPLAQQRTRDYFNHGGAYFPETMDFWGAYTSGDYGWNRAGRKVSEIENPYVRYYYVGILELAQMALEYFHYTNDEKFLRETALPLAGNFVGFYNAHYPRENGVLKLAPAESLETYWDVNNPAPDIAGLRAVLRSLLALPEKFTSAQQRSEWQKLQNQLPPLPQQNGVLLPAAPPLPKPENSENPELYAVFPFGLYGVGLPDLETARRTFAARRFPGNEGWRQDAIQAARLGLADEAKKMLVERFSNKHAGSRFPGFYGPNFDWVPDQDHASVGVLALQEMLLQIPDGKVTSLPAWPKEWDVRFKLHAPNKTLVTR